MDTHYLTSLFTPEKIALFGASDRENSVGGVVFKNLLSSGYEGKIFAINPKHETVQGQPAYATLDAIGESIDLAVVATPATTIPAIVETCGEHGIKMMLILSAGFREIGEEGKKIEKQITEKCQRFGIRMMGPNCLGLIRPDKKLNITFGHNTAKTGNIALVSQSGAICTAILDWAEVNDIGFSAVVSTGIGADLDFGDYLDYLVSDPLTKAILLYIEGINDSRRFMSSLRAAARIKPVIALKVGRHAAGAEASMSHTGALVGSDETFSAALSRSGVLRVQSVSQLFGAARVLSSENARIAADRLVIITNGGGPGVMAADRATDVGIELATLSDKTIEKLNEVLPSVWSHGNPVDIIGDAPPERYSAAVKICLEDEGVDGAVVVLTPQAMTAPTLVAEELVEAAKSTQKPVLTSWMGGGQVAEGRRLLREAHIPTFGIIEDAVDAFSFIGTYNRNQRLLLQTPARLTGEQETADRDGARMIIEGVLNERRKVLTEPESMAILKAFKIPAAANGVATTPNQALVIAESIGYPVAMKILSNDISHKSDAGGVRLNVATAQEVRGAYREMLEQVKKNRPNAKIDGVTIAKMYRSPNARELMIGIIRDPVFGPVISFGSGGTMVEVMGDSEISLPPLNRRLAQDLVDRTKAAKMLGPFRNMPAAATEQLIDILVAVSNLACEMPWIKEMDINPLLLDENGAMAVDARFVVSYPKPSTDPYNHLAIHPYPIHLVSEEQLNDGTDIIIRPIRPEDAEIEQAFIRGLSAESKYFRFMNSIHELSLEMLVRFTQIDYHNEMALVAINADPAGEEEIGVCRYMTNPDKRTCEFAVVVADKWQGKGIARLLMQKLLDIARNRNLEVMEGQVLANNYRMLELMSSMGFKIENDREDPGIKVVSQRLN